LFKSKEETVDTITRMTATICKNDHPKFGKCQDVAVQEGYCGFHWSMHDMIKDFLAKDPEAKATVIKRKTVAVEYGCCKKRRTD
jgi:hypothetical protein